MNYTKEQIAKRIADRRKDIPDLYKGSYDRAMAKKGRSHAIRSFCLECMGWQRNEVKSCTSPQCPLFQYRPYKTVSASKQGTLEE